MLDALSYVRAKVFTANMTGNTVVLGMAIVGPGRSRVFDCAVAILAFALGAFIGARFLLRLQQPDEANDLRMGTLLEAPFAIAFALLWILFPASGGRWVIPALTTTSACALGIQSVAVRRLQISGVATTFMTGTLTRMVVAVMEPRQPHAAFSSETRSSPMLLAGMFVVYVLVAITGAAFASAQSPLGAIEALSTLLIVLARSWHRAAD